MTLAAWVDAHISAFDFFDGVTKRLVVDNLKAGVLKPDLYDPKINRIYQELASHYGTIVDPAVSDSSAPSSLRDRFRQSCGPRHSLQNRGAPSLLAPLAPRHPRPLRTYQVPLGFIEPERLGGRSGCLSRSVRLLQDLR